MDIIVSLWCLEQRKGYFGLTCYRYTMRKTDGIIGSLKGVQKPGQDVFSTILVEVYSFN